jgi:hypothetical protein
VLRLDKAITSLGLTQRAAARRIGATQPELSKILGGKLTESFPRTANALSDRSRLSYRDKNWGRAGKQGRGRHHQGCPTHGRVKPPRNATVGCGIRRLALLLTLAPPVGFSFARDDVQFPPRVTWSLGAVGGAWRGLDFRRLRARLMGVRGRAYCRVGHSRGRRRRNRSSRFSPAFAADPLSECRGTG